MKDGREQHDDWTLLGADEPVGDRRVLVPLARWQSASSVVGISPYGLLVRADDALAVVLAAAVRSPLVAIEFVTFTDGRGYSLARLLRANGFDGDLRAVGEGLRDQAFFLARCGFRRLRRRLMSPRRTSSQAWRISVGFTRQPLTSVTPSHVCATRAD